MRQFQESINFYKPVIPLASMSLTSLLATGVVAAGAQGELLENPRIEDLIIDGYGENASTNVYYVFLPLPTRAWAEEPKADGATALLGATMGMISHGGSDNGYNPNLPAMTTDGEIRKWQEYYQQVSGEMALSGFIGGDKCTERDNSYNPNLPAMTTPPVRQNPFIPNLANLFVNSVNAYSVGKAGGITIGAGIALFMAGRRRRDERRKEFESHFPSARYRATMDPGEYRV
jgi:hypothetical protein